jgi:hypothetical protein
MKMSQRAVQFVSALFAGLLLGTPFVTASHGAPAKAEKCLAKPKGTPPAGGHWYYHTERATKRRCWFIGDAKEKRARRAAPETSPPAANSTSPPKSADTQPSIANARAELPLPRARVEPDTSVVAGQRVAAAVTDTIDPENDPRADADDAGAQRSVVASRWPEMAGVASTQASPEPSIDNSAATPPASSTTGPPASRLAPPAAVAALPLAAADASPSEKPTGSVQMLLISILGALALAGVLVSAIFRLSGRRRNNIRVDRRVNWDSVRADRPSLSDEARADRSNREPGLLPQGSLPRELRASDERIAQMLARPPRSAAT